MVAVLPGTVTAALDLAPEVPLGRKPERAAGKVVLAAVEVVLVWFVAVEWVGEARTRVRVRVVVEVEVRVVVAEEREAAEGVGVGCWARVRARVVRARRRRESGERIVDDVVWFLWLWECVLFR